MRISDWSSDVCAAELELSHKSSEAKLRSVLVPEAHALGMLAAIRSLGRAGYRVHAASPRPDAIGFASRYCTTRARCPAYDAPAYAAWARGSVAGHGTAAGVAGGALPSRCAEDGRGGARER